MTTASIYRSAEGERAIRAFYDEVVARWPVPHQALTLPTRHGDTFALASGPQGAPAVILLHGSSSNSAVWAGEVAAYSARHRVYAVDLLGEPGRSAPSRPTWNGPAHAEWLHDVFAALRLDRAALVGVSLGGWAALQFATVEPARVTHLALLTPGGVAPAKRSFIPQALFCALLGKRGEQRLVRLLFADQPVPDGVDAVFGLIGRHYKPRLGSPPLCPDDALRRLTMPVLLVGGTRDAAFDIPRIAARLQALLPCLEVTLIPGAGHALLDTAPRVLAFLEAHPLG